MNGRRKLAIGLFVAFLLLQLAIASFPRSLVVLIRNEIRWIGQPINWFEANLPEISVIHFVTFLLISLIVPFAFPRAALQRLFLSLIILAIFTEFLQFLVPGRSPGIADLIANLAGILIGLGIVSIANRMAGRPDSSTDGTVS